ncbi:ribbon-helix-helix domain-containing protein [Chelativorans intermedius]|uniref:CopG family transcriptional regulator n=1 Tax=Chelativorans intermedius TaxID=515947 RepID=A0ABV6DB79_9HYPH|nr:CopG family transcriptional regulator [Chelativorans intermedius]MCT9000247.1 ribbon-helix-helix domain-containing protein [Chelativorans intermedius]
MPNRKKAKPMKRVTITVDPDDYETLDQLARRSDVSASWLIRRSMREFLERHGEDRRIEVRPGREVA